MSMSLGGYRPGSGRKKGSIPWNKGVHSGNHGNGFKKGMTAVNKGKKCEWARLKMLGNNYGHIHKGRKMDKAWLLKLRLAKLGKPSGRKGQKLPREWVEKIAASKRGVPQSTEHKIKNREGHYRRLRKIDPNYKVSGRNERIKNNGGFYTNIEWEEVKKRFNFTCPMCKRAEPEIKLTRDHVVPLLLGGSNEIKNIQPLCRSCNCKKHTQTIRF
jgi:5-methylcytosine-specific restriction endonuclease McrA